MGFGEAVVVFLVGMAFGIVAVFVWACIRVASKISRMEEREETCPLRESEEK